MNYVTNAIMIRNWIKTSAIFYSLVILAVTLAGCQTTGYRPPWSVPGNVQVAKEAPRDLSKTSGNNEPVIIPQQALIGDNAPHDVYVDEAFRDNTHGNTAYGNAQKANNGYVDQNGYYHTGPAPQDQIQGQNADQAYSPNTSMTQAQTQTYHQQAMMQIPVTQVAILLPLSGDHAALGQGMLQAAQLALFDLGYEQFQLVPRDTKGTPDGARIAAQEAINSGAQLILGPLFSASVKAVKPIARRHNVNIITYSTDWTLADNNTFVMGFLPFAQVQRVAEYAHSQGIKNVGILAPNNDYGNAVIAAYNSLAYRRGIPSATVVRFPVGESDISAVVRRFTAYDDRVEALNQLIRPLETRLKQNPGDKAARKELDQLKKMETWGDAPYEAVLLPVGGDMARSIANLLSYYDLPPHAVKRLGTGLWDDEGLATESALNGAIYAAAPASNRTEFERKYRMNYDDTPPRLSTLAYDSTALSIVLARNGLKNYGQVRYDRADIMNPNGFAGLDGIFRFRSDGIIERGLALLEFSDGKIQVLDQAPYTFQNTLKAQN